MTIGVCFAAILVGGSVFVRPQEKTPDTILFNGKIFTSDSSLPYAQAVAIRGERIVAVGDSETVKKRAGGQTKKIGPGSAVERETFTGHGFILNSEGLKFFGVTEESKDPLGGRYETDSAGRLSGTVREYAGLDMQRYMSSKVSDADAVTQLR